MRIEGARCLRCGLCELIAPIIREGLARIPIGSDTLEAMAACPTGAIVWCEEEGSEEAPGPPEPDEGEDWDKVDEASWESFPASDPPAWRK